MSVVDEIVESVDRLPDQARYAPLGRKDMLRRIGLRGLDLLGGDHPCPARPQVLGPLAVALGLPELGLRLLDVGLGAGEPAFRLTRPRPEER